MGHPVCSLLEHSTDWKQLENMFVFYQQFRYWYDICSFISSFSDTMCISVFHAFLFFFGTLFLQICPAFLEHCLYKFVLLFWKIMQHHVSWVCLPKGFLIFFKFLVQPVKDQIISLILLEIIHLLLKYS